MLRLAKLTNAEYVLESVAAGVEDYYLGSGEAPGVWTGALAARLGLIGVVDPDELRAVIDGRHPGSGERLIGPKQATVRALDATFSAPKSVSLLWALGSPELSAAVSVAHVEAVEAALRFAESKAAVTRRQVGGIRIRAGTSGWAAATFVHRTSREGDPQLHTHAVIANLVERDDGAWVALDATALYRWAKAAGSVYQEQLRRGLSEQLGVRWGPDRNGCREMTGISEAQLRVFSKRTAQIEAHLAATRGDALAGRKERMMADEAASVATRARKDSTLTPVRLRERWHGEADLVGLPTGDALLDLVTVATGAGSAAGRVEVVELFDRLVDPEVGLCAHDSRFGEAQVVEAVAAWGAGRLTVEDIEAFSRSFLESDRVIRLVNAGRNDGGQTGERLSAAGQWAVGKWSTVAHRRVEDRVLDNLVVLARRQVESLDPAVVDAAITRAARLGGDQVDAVRALASGGPGLRALISPAGYGKTTTLTAAVDAVRASGRPVLAVSTTNQAVDQLCQVGIPAVTVARFALQGVPLEAGCVVIVDEFSQLPTREADTVLAAVATCPDGRVWMVGDPLQAQPVAAGGLASWLAEQVRIGAVPAVELIVNRRQAHPVERQALAAFRQGDIDASQDLRDRQGWEHHHPDRHHALDAMAAAVLADFDIHGSARVAALAVTHADCEALADRIRADLQATGVIYGPMVAGPGWVGSRDYQAGDRIVLHTHAQLDNGRRVPTGAVATVTAVSDGGIVIRVEGGDSVLLPAGFVTGRGPDGRPRMSHAWSRTIDGIQGATYEQVHLLATPALDRYRGYVGQSRSIAPTHTWNTTTCPDSRDSGGRIVEEVYSTPAEQIAAALARAQPKTFAATNDPYRIDRELRAERAALRARLDLRPAEVSDAVARADTLVAEYHQIVAETESALRCRNGLIIEGEAGEAIDRDRRQQAERVEQLTRQIDRHWAYAVVQAARDGYPTAYGIGPLLAARHALSARSHRGDGDPGDLELLFRATTDLATSPADLRSRIPGRGDKVDRPHAVQMHPEPVARRPAVGI